MTIRFRNRLTYIFFFVSLALFLLAVFFTCWRFFSSTLVLPQVYNKMLSDNFLLRYSPVFTFAGIFTNMLYVCITTLVIYHSFEKTQAPDIMFFLLFLLACLCDASRIFVPLFGLSNSFSNFLLKIGNAHLFARLLAPLALMGNTAMAGDSFKQYVDRNCLILIMISIFFAEFIPLNTAVILPNYCISYGYVKGIRLFSTFIIIMSTISLYISNRKNDYKQFMTIGFIMLSIGYTLLFYCYNLLFFASGTLLLAAGTIIYLGEIHKHYLWLD